MRWLTRFLPEPCQHYGSVTRFKDIHRGNDRWYVRGYVECECGFRKCVAVPLPDALNLDDFDKTKYFDEVRGNNLRRAK